MLKRFFAVFFSLVLLLPFAAAEVFAASAAKASIRLSASKITVGDTVTVTVQYSSDAAIGSYDFLLNYDATLLQYVSGADSETGNGKLPFVNYNENSDPKVVSRSVKFKALATGNAVFSTQAKYIVNNDFSLMSTTEANASLTIHPKHTASADNSLKSLSVSGGSFSPEFSPSKTKYSMEVEYGVKKLTVSAVANHTKAKVSISKTDLELGENTVKITVTAENGDKKTYTLTVTRKQSQFANVTTVLNGNVYVFAHDPEALTPPVGFTASSAVFEEKSVLSFVDPDAFFTLVWLTPTGTAPAPSASAVPSSASASAAIPAVPASSLPIASAPTSSQSATPPAPSTPLPPREGWYMLLNDGVTLLPYTPLSASDTQYVPIPIPTNAALPQGCTEAFPVINGESVRAYRSEYCVKNGLYLIYARSSKGIADFYYWHEETGCFYPYLAPETVTVTVTVTQPAPSTPAATQAIASAPSEDSAFWQITDSKLTVFSLGVTALLLILIAVLIPLAIGHARTKKELNRLLSAPRRRITRDPASHFKEKSDSLPAELPPASNESADTPEQDRP